MAESYNIGINYYDCIDMLLILSIFYEYKRKLVKHGSGKDIFYSKKF